MSNNAPPISVVITFPARNEESSLPRVLEGINQQSLKPAKVFILNDGSTDKTAEIAELNELVSLKHRENRGFDIVGKIGLGKVFNECFEMVSDWHQSNNIDYILILAGDMFIPPNYIQSLVAKFEEDDTLMIASGVMKGDFAYKSTGFMVPGPGRMIRYSYWGKLGAKYPLKQGWEAYPIYMANMESLKTKVFDDIEYEPMRATGGRTDYNAYGQAMKAYGYFWVFAIGRSLKQIFMQSRGLKACFNMMRGYFFAKTEYYEDDLRKFVNKTQKKRLRKLILRF